jgi:hypothetical protein
LKSRGSFENILKIYILFVQRYQYLLDALNQNFIYIKFFNLQNSLGHSGLERRAEAVIDEPQVLSSTPIPLPVWGTKRRIWRFTKKGLNNHMKSSILDYFCLTNTNFKWFKLMIGCHVEAEKVKSKHRQLIPDAFFLCVIHSTNLSFMYPCSVIT